MSAFKWFAPVLTYIAGTGATVLIVPALRPQDRLFGLLVGVFFPCLLGGLLSYHIWQSELYEDTEDDEEIVE